MTRLLALACSTPGASSVHEENEGLRASLAYMERAARVAMILKEARHGMAQDERGVARYMVWQRALQLWYRTIDSDAAVVPQMHVRVSLTVGRVVPNQRAPKLPPAVRGGPANLIHDAGFRDYQRRMERETTRFYGVEHARLKALESAHACRQYCL